MAALWAGVPGRVVLGSGQRRTLPPVIVQVAGDFALGARPASGSRTGTGGISGRVTGHGRPLKSVCVSAQPVRGGVGGGAVTSSSGRYRITGLRPGRYDVQFAGPFCGHGNWLSQWYPGVTTPFLSPKAVAIRVRAGTTKTGIDASLKLGGQIGGTVRTRSGTALSGICLVVGSRVRGGFIGYGFESGRGGHYVLHALFPGTYTVQFSIGCRNKINHAPQWWRLKPSFRQATPIKITGPRIVAHVDAALVRGAEISGAVRAVNSSGNPLAGICVQTASRHGDSAFAETGKDGSYQLKGLVGGHYVVEFDPSCSGSSSSNYLPLLRPVSVRPGRSVRGVNAYLQPGAGLSGVVTDAHGHALGGICIQVAGKHGNAFATSNPDGSYSFAGMPAGSYTAQFTGGCGNPGSVAPQYYNNEQSAGSADPITLTAGTITTGINAAMQPGATITGTVTDPAGHRLNGVCVGVANEGQAFLFGVAGFDDIEFTSAGQYRARNLAPGLYQVGFGCGNGPYIGHWFHAGGNTVSPPLLSVPAGVTGGINAVLRPAGAIAGVLTNKAGHRVSFACVSVVEARTGVQVLQSLNQGFVNNGRYKITGLAPGTYKVQFSSCGGAYAGQWYRRQLTERIADPVRVRAGRTTTGIGAILSVGATISGVVVAKATGKPAPGLCAEAYDAAEQSSGFAQTDTTGHYTIRGLSTGRYSVSFLACFGNGPNLVPSTRQVRVTAPHAITGFDARLAAGGSISGTVQAGSRPQTGTCVEAVPVNPAASYGIAFTRGDGSYTMTGLAAGQYQVYFNDPFCGFGIPQFAAQWYNGQPTQATATAVTVSVGATTIGIDASLQPFGGISGTVTGPGNAPVTGECVTAVPVGKGFGDTVPAVFGISASTGGYALADVQPGTYKVRFSTGCGDSRFVTQWWQHASSATAATVVTVGAGSVVTGIDAALIH